MAVSLNKRRAMGKHDISVTSTKNMKAVLYARVSSEVQQKERTIESQVCELRRQLSAAGHVLVKEYLDDGYSGAQLDRPGLDQLRRDLKTDLFHTVYFLNTDRIARDVAYQTIIIAELLKHRKQIIINGKDYVHNPENKFTLTVLGAVAELERAKIIERMDRGKLHRLRSGQLLSHGHLILGYDYVKKTPSSPPALVINEREAEIVRFIFEQYAAGTGQHALIRSLATRGVLTRTGKAVWVPPLSEACLKTRPM
jgi:site-specific DNA recombinase